MGINSPDSAVAGGSGGQISGLTPPPNGASSIPDGRGGTLVWNPALAKYQTQDEFNIWNAGQQAQAHPTGPDPLALGTGQFGAGGEVTPDHHWYSGLEVAGGFTGGALLGGLPGAFAGANLAGKAVDSQQAAEVGGTTPISPISVGAGLPSVLTGKPQTGAPGGTGTTSSPLTSTPVAGSPSFAGINQQTNDITAGLRAQYAASQADRSIPIAAPTAPGQASQATVANLPRVADVSASQAAGEQLQRVGNITASSADPTTLARVDPITGATIDQGASNQTRAQQETSLAGLRAAATGAVPSAAELQLRQSTDRNIKNQYALAAALQGRSAGGALKQASDAAGELDAQSAADAAVLRAKEQSDARNAESAALSGVRGQDIGVATSQAGLTQGAQVQNQNVGVQQNTTAANLDAGNKQFNAGLKQAADITNQGAGITQNATQFNADTDLSKYNAGLRQAADIQNQNTGVTQNATAFGAANDIAKFNATATDAMTRFNATQQQALAIANQDAQLRARQIDDAHRQVILTAMLQAQGLGIQGVSAAAVQQNMLAAQQLARDQLNASTSQADRAYWTNVIASTLQAGAAGASMLQGAGKVPTVNLGGNSTVNGQEIPSSFSSDPGETYGGGDVGGYGSDSYGDTGIIDGGT